MAKSEFLYIFAPKAMKMKKYLLLIDCQYDFIDGKLAVDGSKPIMDNLADYIRTNGKDYNAIWATADWHPITHISFKENGGEWPVHCVQHSHGAAIYEPIMEAVFSLGIDFPILTKGNMESREEYSIFRNFISCNKLLKMASRNSVVDVAGIALDFCVKDTLVDSKKFMPNREFRLLKDFSPSIGSKEEALRQIREHNIEIQ